MQVNPSDVAKGGPELSYLTYYLQNDAMNDLVKCAACPRYAASYEWNLDLAQPFDPRVNIFATQCYPWFGAVPAMSSSTRQMQSRTIVHSNATADGVLFPMYEYVVASVPCPVNTYNRVCAHTKAYYYQTPALRSSYNCTPCPSGYHTAGQTGQWYCQPPLGNIFTFQPLAVIPNLWGNRDILNEAQSFRELECGYLPSHCVQCAENGMAGPFQLAFLARINVLTMGRQGAYLTPSMRPWSSPRYCRRAGAGPGTTAPTPLRKRRVPRGNRGRRPTARSSPTAPAPWAPTCLPPRAAACRAPRPARCRANTSP